MLVNNVTLVGAYRVIEQIGEGGMGAVYVAEHTLLGRRAAIKVLHPMFSSRPDIVERFFNEARAIASIADPGIVQVFDFGFHEGTAYIVMEHLVGETLLARVRRQRRLPEADVLRLARQIALSLHAAHVRGVVHRDLKPENVFIVADPEAVGGERTKILDFGIAKLIDAPDHQHTQTGLMLGTPTYMSPEQCRGAGEIDHRADVYSLGCVLFRCLCGRLPFEARGSGDLIAMHLREPPPRPSSIVQLRPELDEIVLRCLAKHPDDRYSSMFDLATELDQLLRSITSPPGLHISALTPLPPSAPLPLTPPTDPQIILEPTQPPIPTTLSSAAAQTSPSLTRMRWAVIAAVALALVGLGVGTMIATTRGKVAVDDQAATVVTPTVQPRAATPTPEPAPSPPPAPPPQPTLSPQPVPPLPAPPLQAVAPPQPAVPPALAASPQPAAAVPPTRSSPTKAKSKAQGKTTLGAPDDDMYNTR
jgi:eukaryotic-like serine/threonine-protein kinase